MARINAECYVPAALDREFHFLLSSVWQFYASSCCTMFIRERPERTIYRKRSTFYESNITCATKINWVRIIIKVCLYYFAFFEIVFVLFLDSEKKYEMISKSMKQKSESDTQKIKLLQNSNSDLTEQLKSVNEQLTELKDSKKSADDQLTQLVESKVYF